MCKVISVINQRRLTLEETTTTRKCGALDCQEKVKKCC